MLTSSNGNIFRVTGLLCGNSPVTGEFPSQRPVTRSFVVFFDLHLNERLGKQSRGWWFGTPSRPLWRHSNAWITKGTRVKNTESILPLIHIMCELCASPVRRENWPLETQKGSGMVASVAQRWYTGCSAITMDAMVYLKVLKAFKTVTQSPKGWLSKCSNAAGKETQALLWLQNGCTTVHHGWHVIKAFGCKHWLSLNIGEVSASPVPFLCLLWTTRSDVHWTVVVYGSASLRTVSCSFLGFLVLFKGGTRLAHWSNYTERGLSGLKRPLNKVAFFTKEVNPWLAKHSLVNFLVA